MNISEVQTVYDNQSPYDHECEECESWKRRGDESFDLYQQELIMVRHQEEVIESLADRLRERDELIAKYVSRFGVLEIEE